MSFDLHLKPELAKALRDLGYSEFTEIQLKSIPIIKKGYDVIGQSMTGSGKTFAFALPIIEKISHGHGIQALILVPTRELCEQVSTEMAKFSKYKRTNIAAIYGGVSINPQFSALKHADAVVATPGRMLDHIQRGTINLGNVKILVLDEADKMFEMGFIDNVRDIISRLPHERQTLLFSATMPPQVMDIVRHYMKNPQKIRLMSYVEHDKLEQFYYQVNSRDKFSLLVHLLKSGTGLTIIFCATRKRVDVVSKNLYKNGIRSISLHGGLTQNRRKKAMELFHQSKAKILVASDVAARGLDIKDVEHIINYDIPKTSKEYIHRIGRTARAGAQGKVISLLSPEDHDNFRSVLEDRSIIVKELKAPEFERVRFFASPHGSRQRQGYGHRQGYQRRESRGYSRESHGKREGYSRDYGQRSSYSHARRGSYGHRQSHPQRSHSRQHRRFRQ